MTLPESTQQVARLWRELPSHTDSVTDAAWSPNGDYIASIGRDKRLNIFRLSTNTAVHTHLFTFPLMHVGFLNDNVLILCDFASTLRSYAWAEGRVMHTWNVNVERASTMALSPAIGTAALGYKTGLVEFAEYRDERGTLTTKAFSVAGPVWEVEWSASGDTVYIGSNRDGVTIVDYRDHYILAKFPGAGPIALSEPNGLIAVFQKDLSITVYRINNGKRVASLEGSTSKFGRITFTEDGAYLIAKSLDGSCFIWTTANWKLVSLTHETVIYPRFPLSTSPINPLAFLSTGSMQKSVVVRELSEPDLPELSSLVVNPQYKNCKVVIMGEQGVGKSALANQLLGRGWRLTESTHGRQVTRLMRERVGTEYRELYLWDLAGQPNYHLIHQLHLDETYVALVMFDDRLERDPFARPRYWDRALSTAVVNSTFDAEGINKILVAGRVDRGDPQVSPEAIQRFIAEHGFKNYFRTSARTSLGISSLRDAILNSIKWEDLPSVSSTALFQEVQQLILDVQSERVHVLPTQEAYQRLLRLVPAHRPTFDEFRTCVALLESRGLIRRLSFNDSILFSPEYLDAYASAIVNQARVDPNGLGSVTEDEILKGRFLMNKSERMADPALEKDLIIATVEDIILRQLAFREVTPDGAIIVFPSQFTRENPDLPAPDGIELRIRFAGPLQNIYSTTTVRLFYADQFNVTEIWKNGVVVRDSDNRRAGFQISDFADGQGEIALFFEHGVAVDFKLDFIDFVQQHIFQAAAAGSIRTRKVFRCTSCTTEFTDAQIGGRKSRGFSSISCSVCGVDNPLSLIEESVRVSAPTRNTAVAIASAQEAAEREANVAVGSAMVQSLDIRRWLGEGAAEAHVVIVFTDIVSSTKANNDLGDLAMDEIKEAHFATLSRNAARYKGRILKNTGDGVLAIFRTTPQAAQFALSSARAPGHDEIRIRAGIHVGRVKPKDNDIFGQTVNFAARVQSSLADSGVILSDDAKRDLERIHGKKQEFFRFKMQDGQELKGFDGKYTLWLIDHFSEGYLESVR